ncbi:MAG: HAD hydrolase family protein [Candidatus Ancaeobacter aquaticus]|nr:HAD hydrolase family protein [Candidatus Ancaeobacter aquaticus]
MNTDALKNIKLFVTDVDGVFTDGKIILDAEGKELKKFNVHDGAAVKYAALVGFRTIMISGRDSGAVTKRAKEIGIYKAYQGISDKAAVLEKIITDESVTADQMCFIGDDLPDIAVLKRVGFSVAVKNAVSEVKEVADYVTEKSGGDGAFREVVELVLKSQGHWKELLKKIS